MKSSIHTLIASHIKDNKEYIKDYEGGNIREYLWADLDAMGDEGFFWYLTDEEITLWESGDEAEVERLSQEVMDLIGQYNVPVEEYFRLKDFLSDTFMVTVSSEGHNFIKNANRDPLFDEAARLIVTHQQGSTSLIQRRMKLGYNRAGRLIVQLEAAGIVGPFESSKARKVLVQDEYALEQLLNSLSNKNG